MILKSKKLNLMVVCYENRNHQNLLVRFLEAEYWIVEEKCQIESLTTRNVFVCIVIHIYVNYQTCEVYNCPTKCYSECSCSNCIWQTYLEGFRTISEKECELYTHKTILKIMVDCLKTPASLLRHSLRNKNAKESLYSAEREYSISATVANKIKVKCVYPYFEGKKHIMQHIQSVGDNSEHRKHDKLLPSDVDHNCNEKTESSQHLWQRRDSFSSCSSDSAVYCSSRHTQMKGSMPDAFSKLSYESSRSKGSCDNKRQRHSSGSSMISVASDSSNKETHSTSTVTDIVADFQVPSQFDKNNMQIGGQNLRLVTRIEASQSSVASKSNQNVRSSKSKLHTVVTEEAYICKPAEQPPQYTTHSYHDLRRNIRRKIACSHGDCKHDNHTTFIFRRYTEIQHATRPSVFSTQGSSQHRNVSPELHRSTLVSSPNSSKRPRKSEIDRLYDSLHEIKWAKHFSPENILKQNEYRRTASQISFNKEKDRNSGLLKAHCSSSAGNKLLTLKPSDISKNRISFKRKRSRENFLKNLKNTQNSKKCFTPLNSGASITLSKRRDGNRFCTRSSQSRHISKNLARTSRVTRRNILTDKEKPVSKTHFRRQTRSSTNPVLQAANLTPHQSSIVNRKNIILRSDSAKGNVECKEEKTFDVCLDNVNIKKEKKVNSEFVNNINEINEISTKFKLNMDSSGTQSQPSRIKDPKISIVENVNSDASCSFSQSSHIPEIVPAMSEMPLQNNRAEKLLERNLNTTDTFNEVNYLKSASQEIVLPESSLPENISIQFCYTSKSEALTTLAESHSPHKSQCDISENFHQNDVVDLASKDESLLDNNYLCLKAEDSFSHSESSDLPVLSTENSPIKINENFCDMPPVLEPCLLLPNRNCKATSQQSITSVELTEVGNSYPEYSSEIFGGHESSKANFSRNNMLSEAVYKTELDMPSEEFKCKPFKDSDVESLEMHDSLLQSVHINNALEVSSKASDPNVIKSDKLRCLERKSLTHPVNLRTHNTCKLIIKKYVKGVTKKVKLKRTAENASWNSTSTCDRMQNTTVINKKFQNCDCHRKSNFCNCFNSACTNTQRVTTSVNNRFKETDNTKKYISNRNINLSRTYFKYGKFKVGENSWQTTSSNNSATNFDIPSYSSEKGTLCKPLHSDSLQVERFKGATTSKNVAYRKIPRIGYTANKDSKRNTAEDRQLTVFQPHALPSASRHSEKKSDCDEKALRSKISYYGFTFHYKGITVNKNDSYTQVILKLSSSRNIFLSVEALAELKDTLNSAVNDANCQVLIVNGTGNSFCSGLDLKPLIGPRKKDASKEMAVAVKEFIEALASFHKPLVSVVNGSAVGLGVTLLTYSDVVLASDTATFHMPYTQLGYMPEGAGTLTLPQVVGATVAMDMLLRGRMITARQALDYGLVSEVLEANMLPQQLVSRVRVLAENPVTAMETTKSMLRWHLLEKLHVALDNELQMLPKQWLSPTCQMALKKAFQNGLLGD